MVNQGKSSREIDEALDRSHTTISRQLKRYKTRFEYSPSKAYSHAGRLTTQRGIKPIIYTRPEVWYEAVKKLIKDNSKEQIRKTFKMDLSCAYL